MQSVAEILSRRRNDTSFVEDFALHLTDVIGDVKVELGTSEYEGTFERLEGRCRRRNDGYGSISHPIGRGITSSARRGVYGRYTFAMTAASR
jgi:hypothetical protein